MVAKVFKICGARPPEIAVCGIVHITTASVATRLWLAPIR